MKRERPIPMGEMNVAACFSPARRKMVITSWKVRNISIRKPWATEVCELREVWTASLPGKMAFTIAEAAIEPRIWDMARRLPRTQGRAETRHMPNVTCKRKREDRANECGWHVSVQQG